MCCSVYTAYKLRCIYSSSSQLPAQVSFDGKLLALCDRTGLMYKVSGKGDEQRGRGEAMDVVVGGEEYKGRAGE